jgi:hypothetical protein
MVNMYPLPTDNPAETGSALDKRYSPASHPSTTHVKTSLSPVPTRVNVPLPQAATIGYGGRYAPEDQYKARSEGVEDAQPQGLITSLTNYLFSWSPF